MKRLVIVPGMKYYFFNEIEDDELYLMEESFVSCSNKIKRNIQRVAKKIGIWQIYYLFMRDWKNKLKECDTCIIFDQAFSVALVNSILFIKPNIKIKVYIWNSILKDVSLIKKLNKVAEKIDVYSFDKNDCEKYGFTFSPMVYNFNVDCEEKAIKYDVIFVGFLKNRGELLKNTYNYLKSINTNCFFYVLNDINTQEDYPFDLYSSYMDYDKYREKMLSSKAVLDIAKEGQVGLTIRTMETLCYKKKIITNNLDIKNYDFYNSNNIFILGEDDIETLDDFLKKPYQAVAEEIIKKYNFVDWAKNL